MRTVVWAASIATLLGLFVVPQSASAAPPGCVDLLVDCDPASASMTTVCGIALHDLTQIPWDGGTVANNISFVVFGSNVHSVTLTQCGTGATLVITQNTNLCNVPGSWNDNVCDLTLSLFTPAAPTLSTVGLSLLGAVLFAGGALALRRRRPGSETVVGT